MTRQTHCAMALEGGLLMCFPWLDWACGFWGGDHRGEGSFSSHPVRAACCQCDCGSPRDLGHWLRWYLSGCPTLQLPFHTVLFERKLCAAHTWEWAGVAQRWAEQLHQGLGVRAATVKGHSQLLAIMKTGRTGEEQAGAAGKPWSC